MRLTNFHIAVSSFAAIAGLALAAYQALAPTEGPQVAGALDTPTLADSIGTSAIDLVHGASFTAALKDGADLRYRLAALFDGDPRSYVTIEPPDLELNVQVNFSGIGAQRVTAIEYAPPPGADPARLATLVDLMVLPDGQMAASGLPVMSFSLQRSAGSQTFAIPGNAQGKGLWLRISGPQDAAGTVVGDFRVLQEGVAAD